VWERREALKEFWCVNLRERNHLEGLGLDGIINGKVRARNKP
jgi:hypothetical protein